MTFLELQTRVLNRVNWSSTEARELVKDYLNERYRQVCSSVNAARTRRGVVSFNTVNGSPNVSISAAKVFNIFDAVYLKSLLNEVTVTDIRARDAAAVVVGRPTDYAVEEHENDTVQLMFFPKPNGVYALQADVLKTGTDMTDNADQPTIPEDFQDVLILGAVADVLDKMEKWAAAQKQEAKFEKRLGELRYFLIKSAHLRQTPQDNGGSTTSATRWPYSNMA